MSRAMKDMPAWGISLVVNLSILAVFHFIVYETGPKFDATTITSVVDDSHQEQHDFSDAVNEDQIGTEGDRLVMAPSLSSATSVQEETTPQEKIEEFLNPVVINVSENSLPVVEGNLSEAVNVKGTSEDATSGGMEGAMDRVAFEIRQSLHERRTLVVWMFDASGSLEERREAVAARFDNIYKQLGQLGTTEGLYTAIYSYGKDYQLLTPQPIQDVAQLSEIVRKNIKEDKSGDENVFTAANAALLKFRTWHRSDGPLNKLFFIVTDEKGDDAQGLEEVITLAKRSQARFYTIGNAAIFGQQRGYVRWVYDDGFEEDIPVDQGPETAFPDGVQLPFIGASNDWKLRRMSASYGPYALTRLCAETGGMYLVTAESRGYNFDRSIMRSYAPDYRPSRLQEQEIKKNPAKTALVTVAQMTYDDALPVPALTFRAYNDTILRQDLGEAQRPVAEIDYKLRRMFDTLAAGEKGYENIREPRWRAAYSCAMGRLLAMRVRYSGYNHMLANMKTSPKEFMGEKNNMWRLIPSEEIATGPEFRKAATKAKEYLKAVIDEHPGTPWALLAERELSAPLGWSWEEFSQPIPGSEMTRASEEEVARLLLAEEEERQRRQQQAAKPRERPKL